MENKELILRKLNKLQNSCHFRIGRAADMIWISFIGEDKKEYALHLQTFFRFCTEDEVLITDMDKYQPISELKEPYDFNWDIKGENKFDKWCEKYNKEFFEYARVKCVKAENNGDLTIIFDNHIVLEVLIETTTGDECWRFFEKNNLNSHFVVTGNGIMNEE